MFCEETNLKGYERPAMYLGWGVKEDNTEKRKFWRLRCCIIAKYVVRMEGGWNWLSVMASSDLWYRGALIGVKSRSYVKHYKYLVVWALVMDIVVTPLPNCLADADCSTQLLLNTLPSSY
jgi:biotin transporter BioY